MGAQKKEAEAKGSPSQLVSQDDGAGTADRLAVVGMNMNCAEYYAREDPEDIAVKVPTTLP